MILSFLSLATTTRNEENLIELQARTELAALYARKPGRFHKVAESRAYYGGIARCMSPSDEVEALLGQWDESNAWFLWNLPVFC